MSDEEAIAVALAFEPADKDPAAGACDLGIVLKAVRWRDDVGGNRVEGLEIRVLNYPVARFLPVRVHNVQERSWASTEVDCRLARATKDEWLEAKLAPLLLLVAMPSLRGLFGSSQMMATSWSEIGIPNSMSF